MSNYLTHKVVWLTGASSGIGEALAFELSRRGAKVGLTSRRADALHTLAERLKTAKGLVCEAAADVTSESELHAALTKIEAELGAIDIVIANAGTHIESHPEKFNSTEYIDLMNTNYGGVLRCFEALIPKMVVRNSGHVVAVSSLTGYRGLPTAAAYGASKAAIINFCESLRFHLEKFSIAVTIVCPGFVKTPLTDRNKFHMPFLISSEKAAGIICDGIERRKKEIAFPFPFSWILKTARILPYPLYETVIRSIWSRM